MIQTILQFSPHSYPFACRDDHVNLKLETLIDCPDSASFVRERKKYQAFRALAVPYCIRLTQIYQESLRIHLIYQYVHRSLAGFIKEKIAEFKEGDLNLFKKDMLRRIAAQLGELVNFFCNSKILTSLHYRNIGVDEDYGSQAVNPGKGLIQYFVGIQFQFSDYPREKLLEFYQSERRKILGQVEHDLELGKRPDYLPNFILRGNKLVFTDELSETKTRKKRSQSPERQRFEQPRQGRSNAKPKKHKYSCNFEEQNLNFQEANEQMNKSFEQESQNYSITKTKSMKIEMQHQRPTKKNRKNSLKFKITTFEQISIDQSVDEDEYEQYDKQRHSYAPEPNPEPESRDSEKKDYKQKVKEAKQKAETLLNKYLKTKNRSAYK